MTDAHPARSPNFLRDQFILTAILVIALICRSSLVSSKTVPSDHASQSPSTTSEAIASSK